MCHGGIQNYLLYRSRCQYAVAKVADCQQTGCPATVPLKVLQVDMWQGAAASRLLC